MHQRERYGDVAKCTNESATVRRSVGKQKFLLLTKTFLRKLSISASRVGVGQFPKAVDFSVSRRCTCRSIPASHTGVGRFPKAIDFSVSRRCRSIPASHDDVVHFQRLTQVLCIFSVSRRCCAFSVSHTGVVHFQRLTPVLCILNINTIRVLCWTW